MTEQIFQDRFGNFLTPGENDTVRHRRSIHLLLFWRNHLLLTYPPYAPDSSELPGGGIEDGENMIDAAKRELAEETGLSWPKTKEKKPQLYNNSAPENSVFEQKVRFYAGDVCEYWHYHMTFWRLDVTEPLPGDWPKQPAWRTKTGEYVCWTTRTALPPVSMNVMHINALMNLLGHS